MVVGGIKSIGSLVLLTLFVLNLLDQINLKQDVLQRIYKTAPYLISAVFIYYLDIKIILIIIMYILGIITIIDQPLYTDLSGSILFIFIFCIIPTIRVCGWIAITSIISVTIRSLLLNCIASQSIIAILGYFSIYLLFYFIVYLQYIKPLQKKKEIHKNFTDQEKQLIKLLRSGETQKTAGHIMSLSPNGANDMLKKLKKESGCKTTIEFFSSL